jgi:hypothetical protein
MVNRDPSTPRDAVNKLGISMPLLVIGAVVKQLSMSARDFVIQPQMPDILLQVNPETPKPTIHIPACGRSPYTIC